MKTVLYVENGKVKTFDEIRNEYIDCGYTDSVLKSKISSGVLDGVYSISDSVLDWCNDCADYKESDRFLSQVERDESVRDIYIDICCCTEDRVVSYVQTIKDLSEDEEGLKLIHRFFRLVGSIESRSLKSNWVIQF